MKKRGSAIIIAMLLISAVGTIAFSFSRDLFIEIANTNLYENGTVAYYTAESGIEDGLLRLRLDRNAEVPFDLTKDQVLASDNRVIRSNLTENSVITTDLLSGSSQTQSDNLDSASQIYDLKINAKTDIVSPGHTANSTPLVDLVNYDKTKDTAGNYLIKRDETKSFDLSNIFNTSDVNFWFRPLDSDVTLPAPFNEKKCVLLEAKIVGQQISGAATAENKIVFYSNYPGCDYTKVFAQNNLSAQYLRQYAISGDGTVKIQNIKSIVWPTVLLAKSFLAIKPIGADIAYAIERKDPASNDLMYGPTTKIESVGYYGDVARKLEADVDRQTGTLYDLFDYVIYKAK